MMRIDSLSANPDRAGKHLVQFSDGSVMKLYRQTIADFGLYSGIELTGEEYRNLKVAAGQMSAKMRAVRIVAASGVSKKDLEMRLIQKGESTQDAKNAVAWMSELDLIDDKKTAEHIVSNCIQKGYGISRAKQALFEKKIPKEIWSEVLSEYPDQTDKILIFLKSKLPDEPTERDLRRAIDAALRRGHSYSQIKHALSLLDLDSDEFPEG